jgi:hypothetical protein
MEFCIDSKAMFLPEETRKRFYHELVQCLYFNKTWRKKHGLTSFYPEIDEAKEILFNEKYADKMQFFSIEKSKFEEISETRLLRITTPTAEELLLR